MAAPVKPAIDAAERLARLRLWRSENVGPITFHRLMARFGSGRAALDALPDLARRGGRSRPVTLQPAAEAERELAALEALGAVALCCGETGYPSRLAELEDAPPLLAALGRVELLSRDSLAIVGARNASGNGRRLARQLAADLGAQGYIVVSGLARGIDAAAHEGALGTGTVAVLAGGLDVVYPRENAALHAAIAADGVLVSEMPPGLEPQARHFPPRNRLISGLAWGVVVVEAALRSGSLITARLAAEQGREVFAVPGSPLDPRARGCNRLLRDGATLTESAEDVVAGLSHLGRPRIAEPRAADFQAEVHGIPKVIAVDGAHARLRELLGVSPVAVDELIRQCQLSPAVANMALLEMELAGRVERHPGNRVSLIVGDRADGPAPSSPLSA